MTHLSVTYYYLYPILFAIKSIIKNLEFKKYYFETQNESQRYLQKYLEKNKYPPIMEECSFKTSTKKGKEKQISIGIVFRLICFIGKSIFIENKPFIYIRAVKNGFYKHNRVYSFQKNEFTYYVMPTHNNVTEDFHFLFEYAKFYTVPKKLKKSKPIIIPEIVINDINNQLRFNSLIDFKIVGTYKKLEKSYPIKLIDLNTTFGLFAKSRGEKQEEISEVSVIKPPFLLWVHKTNYKEPYFVVYIKK